MIDGHIHIEKQEYSLELIQNMVDVAIEKGIDELNILDHTHKFKEFSFLYSSLKDEASISWYKRKKPIPLQVYLDFIKLVKEKEWPIKLNFGLEVCYFPSHEEELKKILKDLPKFDFLIGSVHFVDEIGIDIDKDIFNKVDVDLMYKHYFETNEKAVKSQIFTYIGHPDEIKLFAPKPSFDLKPYYEHLAQVMEKYNQVTENNSGLIRYGFPYPGLAPELFKSLVKHNVKIIKSSDAHVYTDIGRVFDKIEDNIR